MPTAIPLQQGRLLALGALDPSEPVAQGERLLRALRLFGTGTHASAGLRAGRALEPCNRIGALVALAFMPAPFGLRLRVPLSVPFAVSAPFRGFCGMNGWALATPGRNRSSLLEWRTFRLVLCSCVVAELQIGQASRGAFLLGHTRLWSAARPEPAEGEPCLSCLPRASRGARRRAPAFPSP